MIRALLLLLALAGPLTAEPYSREFCRPDRLEVDPVAVPPEMLAEVRALAAGMPNGSGRLWQVTAPGGAVSYLWGTMHVNDPRILDLPDALRAVLAEAGVVMVEWTGLDITRDVVNRAYDPASVYGPDRDAGFLGAIVPEAALLIRDQLEDLGYLPDWHDQIRGATLLSVVMVDRCNELLAMANYPLQDTRIELLGLDAGAQVIGLERVDDLDRLMNDPVRRDLARAILTTYALGLPLVDLRVSSLALYQQGEIAQMMALERVALRRRFPTVDTDAVLDLADSHLLTARNRAMVEAALPRLAEGGAVMATGAYHLPGETGLLALLEARGYTISRITLPEEEDLK